MKGGKGDAGTNFEDVKSTKRKKISPPLPKQKSKSAAKKKGKGESFVSRFEREHGSKPL